MKKVYFAPAVEEVELDMENVILAGSSVIPTNNDENDANDITDI